MIEPARPARIWYQSFVHPIEQAPYIARLPLLHRSYWLMRQTIALRPPLVSLLRPIFAGCCQPLLRNGPSRRYSANLSLRAWTPTPAASTVLALVSSRETLAFPR